MLHVFAWRRWPCAPPPLLYASCAFAETPIPSRRHAFLLLSLGFCERKARRYKFIKFFAGNLVDKNRLHYAPLTSVAYYRRELSSVTDINAQSCRSRELYCAQVLHSAETGRLLSRAPSPRTDGDLVQLKAMNTTYLYSLWGGTTLV